MELSLPKKSLCLKLTCILPRHIDFFTTCSCVSKQCITLGSKCYMWLQILFKWIHFAICLIHSALFLRFFSCGCPWLILLKPPYCSVMWLCPAVSHSREAVCNADYLFLSLPGLPFAPHHVELVLCYWYMCDLQYILEIAAWQTHTEAVICEGIWFVF